MSGRARCVTMDFFPCVLRGVLLLAAAALFAVSTVFLAPPSSASADAELLDAAPDSIEALRAAGEYAQALGLARDLLAGRRTEADTPVFEIDDAERLVATLETISAMPPDRLARMAEADSLYAAANDALDAGSFAEAASCSERAAGLRRELLGRAHLEVADALSLLGVIRLYDNEPEAAEPLFIEALAIRRPLLGVHPDVAGEEANLAQVKQSLGDNAAAEDLSRQAIEMYQMTGAVDRPDYAYLVSNLATILLSRGDYAAADPLFREALSRLRPLVGEDSLELVIITANLASLQQKMGNEAAAADLYREALEMQERVEPGDHPNTALYLTDLAVVQERMGDLPAAEQSCRRALAMQQTVLDEADPDLAVTSIILGRILLADGQAEAAAGEYRRALEISSNAGRSVHPHAASAHHGLGLALFAEGDLVGASASLRRAIALREELLGEAHPYTVESRIRLALVARSQGDLALADSLLTAAARSYEAARLRAGTGLERASFMGSPYPYLAVVRLERDLAEAAWPEAEHDLARVLSDLLRAFGSEHLDPAVKAERDARRAELRALEKRLAVHRAQADEDTAGEAAARAQATRDTLLLAESRWAAFMGTIAAGQGVDAGRPFDLERIQAALSAETALVGWCEAEMAPGDNACWGYAIRKDGPVRWGRIGGQDQDGGGSAGQWRAFAEALSSPASSEAGLMRSSRALYDERVAPLEPFLDGVRTLVVIPSESVRGVPLETLARPDGTRLGDRFAVSYAPSATIFAWLAERSAERRATPGRALFIGDPPFSEAQRDMMAREAAHGAAGADGAAPEDGEGTRGSSFLAALPRLAASREEVSGLAALWPESRVLLGADASEPQLVRLAEADSLADFRWIHFSTHGLLDDRHPENSALVLSQVDLPDPLDGAIEGSRIHDGLLTAKEIAGEWRLDADLVSLSACQTGRGRELRGEGTVGLAHAFFQSGARSLLVSLWKVEDRATALLMKRFGENIAGVRLGEGAAGSRFEPMEKAEALWEAKAWLRDLEENGRRPYGHPYHWSAFVLIGGNR